jgi:glycerol kinase
VGARPRDVAAIGITNQRETVIVWERATGKAIHPAIVWQDRRTAAQCKALEESGAGETVSSKTGLVLDPYFSATKVKWILDTWRARGRVPSAASWPSAPWTVGSSGT